MVLAQFQSGVEAPLTASLALGAVLLAALVNPWARRRTITHDAHGARLPRRSLTLGAALAALVWVVAGALAGPVLDALGVSAPNWRIAVGLVAAVAAVVDLVRGPASPGAALAGTGAALVPVCVPGLLRADAVLVASHVGLEHGLGAAVLVSVLAAGPTVLWALVAREGDVARRVEAAAARAVAALALVLGAALVLDGVLGL